MRIFILAGLLVVCHTAASQKNKISGLSAEEILKKSIARHDPSGVWSTTRLHLYIQEPRVETPSRYSILDIDRKSNKFMLERNRDEHVSRHTIDSLGNATILLDGRGNIPQPLVEKYRLDSKTNFGFRRFYTLLYGLPMSLRDEEIQLSPAISERKFNGQDVFVVEGELKTPMISKFWRLFLTRSDFRLMGLELYDPQDITKGERILLDDPVSIQKIEVNRMRHWYKIAGNEYLGSDIIIKEIL